MHLVQLCALRVTEEARKLQTRSIAGNVSARLCAHKQILKGEGHRKKASKFAAGGQSYHRLKHNKYEADLKNNLRAGAVQFIRTEFEFVFESPCYEIKQTRVRRRSERAERVAPEIYCNIF